MVSKMPPVGVPSAPILTVLPWLPPPPAPPIATFGLIPAPILPEAEPAGAAAAADTLGDQGMGIRLFRGDVAGGLHRYDAAVVAAAAAAANRDLGGDAGTDRAAADAGADGEAPFAAGPADALGEDPVRTDAVGVDVSGERFGDRADENTLADTAAAAGSSEAQGQAAALD